MRAIYLRHRGQSYCRFLGTIARSKAVELTGWVEIGIRLLAETSSGWVLIARSGLVLWVRVRRRTLYIRTGTGTLSRNHANHDRFRTALRRTRQTLIIYGAAAAGRDPSRVLNSGPRRASLYPRALPRREPDCPGGCRRQSVCALGRLGARPRSNRNRFTYRCDSLCRRVRWHRRCSWWSGSYPGTATRRFSATALDRTSDVHVGGADTFWYRMSGQPLTLGRLAGRTRHNSDRQGRTISGSSANRSRFQRNAG